MERSLSAAVYQTFVRRLDPPEATKRALMVRAVRVLEHENAIAAARLLKEALPGVGVPGVELSGSGRDGRVRVLGDTGASRWVEVLTAGAAAAGVEVDLPFGDVTSWIDYCEAQGVTGPGSGPAQAALAAEVLDPVLEQLAAFDPLRDVAPS